MTFAHSADHITRRNSELKEPESYQGEELITHVHFALEEDAVSVFKEVHYTNILENTVQNLK